MHESENLGIVDSEELKKCICRALRVFFSGIIDIWICDKKAEIGQNGPKFRVLYAKKTPANTQIAAIWRTTLGV